MVPQQSLGFSEWVGKIFCAPYSPSSIRAHIGSIEALDILFLSEKMISASEGFMYDDRPLFLSIFYSDTLFGLVLQIVKELKIVGVYSLRVDTSSLWL